ncbi:mono-functional DNA-alkylating methyl methanesulfonate N-term-domain-containing protein [Aspergillus coremiiformis]|uniref:Mono-functional DNA-alkylating methyl methanesulfonate N-term-domain-containing protein n=1 Tax=Aspergillus coremiiformis TaxID=138285 RepID=A0A5N6Z635_9EURO|nr:mono-functional DNA-alkylating methyl methanesulfonate N-term-domain-containing protein [Aspergillus coremiiformis]
MAFPRNHQDAGPHGTNASVKRRSMDQMDIEDDILSSDAQPKMGLLSRTLIPTPIIQWILPARLRSEHQNDVVFVGERSLQIKEAVSGIHLEDITAKTDFESNIMAAKVINVSSELPWESQMKMGANSAAVNSDLQMNLPPQMLMLSLASRELVFLYYSTSSDQFIHHHRPLPNDVSTFERFGRNVAVEPRSRAVAVSASSDYFGVFTLRQPPVLQSQIAHNQLDPIAEERFFRVDGDIIFMEFLYPRNEDDGKILLLLLVAQDQITHAICYEWDASEDLRHASPVVTKRLLPFEDRLPTILVPLTKTSSFLIVTTTTMAVYKNRLDPRRQPSRYPLCVPDQESRRSPLWTRWARPLRNWLYNQKHDDIYLCREDGQIFYLGIGNEGEVENQAHLGQLCCDVDAAFDILDFGHEGGDLLLAAGNTGDGGLFVQKAREHPRCVQKFMNWSPVTDSVVVKSPNQQSPLSADVAGDRLFVCSNSSFAQGGIVELRHGIEAQIGLVVSLDGMSSTRDIWTMSTGTNGGVTVLTSDPESSVVLDLPADFEEEISAIDDAESGLDCDSQTLAAGCTDSGVIIQVTDKAIRLGATAESMPSSGFQCDYDQSIIVAAVNAPASLIVAAVRNQYGLHLHAIHLTASGDLSDVRGPLRIHFEPVCISVETFDFGSFIFVGAGNGKIFLYSVEGKAITFVSERPTDVAYSEDISKAIDSVAIVNKVEEGPLRRFVLLCGLRSGILVPFGVTLDIANAAASIVLRQACPQRLGHTSLSVQSRGDLALLTCGQGFWQISCTYDGLVPDCSLQRIWITDQNNPAYHPRSIYSFSLTNFVNSDVEGLSNTLFCIADGQLMVCTLQRDEKTVPRRIGLPGSATKLAYSHYLKSLVVAYSRNEFDTDADPIKRYTRSYIEFVDPDSQQKICSPFDASEDESNPWRPHGAAGEKISCILEWTPKKSDEEYHFIVIGTARKNQQDRGRVIFLQASRLESNPSRIECTVKYVHRFEGPVYSIAPYGNFTLMVSTGHEIVPLEPKFSQTRWLRAARYSVLSPAVSMSCHEPYLYMSTSRESLTILNTSEEKLVLHAYDRQKHDGLSHVHIGGEMQLTLASSRGGRVSLLTERGVTENDKMMPVALCEAHLSSSVTRLSPGTRHSSMPTGSHVIYGTAMNGTVYRFLTLREKEWRLLRLVQNLCIRDMIICPFTPKRKRQRNPAGNESLDFQPSQMHIDGDVLSRLLIRGPGYLMYMLATEEFYSPSMPETGSPQAIYERFSELSKDLLGESLNPIEDVMKWLKRTLQVGF